MFDLQKYQLVIAIICAIVFIILAVINPYLGAINMLIRHYIAEKRNLRWRSLMILTHRYNDVLLLSLQTMILAIIIGFLLDDLRRAMILMSAMFIQTTVVGISKRLSSIARPPQLLTHVIMKSSSYPSGHSAASMTFAFLVPIILRPFLPFPLIIVIAVYLVVVALLTAYGRLFLDVHWLSDIVGGWLLSAMTILMSRMFLMG